MKHDACVYNILHIVKASKLYIVSASQVASGKAVQVILLQTSLADGQDTGIVHLGQVAFGSVHLTRLSTSVFNIICP